ncbi:D-alanyl-D-alanine-carboxypeptidase/endopeptidase AmpH precursor [Pseudobythopirellula maris]|uniref:D-alanyl-D-alanine-carboxypeptidase/endopeptidase AmpH n=1 Tax=Pseudobythopirellula maris TaxID=2527991 RepID=A0A5C5ZJS3_9BACT|nr:serine hydrolase domain-containing protein [Pseudobythopirellula maris]TWT87365.1 D-alanyl-D-alanine-carboxypeptidase/endopeptidase AmpH precursor [Pseudobythopirellula maris]
MLTRLILLFLAFLPVASARAIDRAEVERLAQPLIDAGLLVGCTIGVVDDDGVRFFAFGEMEKGAGVAPDEHTVYEVGSFTKALTGTLLADAQLRGLLSEGDTLSAHTPEGIKVPELGEPITLAHLATHTSGLPRLPPSMTSFKSLLFLDALDPYAGFTRERVWGDLAKTKPARPPGEDEYSNFGMGVLGLVLERATDKSYEELLVERLCAPLGMSDTRVALTDSMRERFAPPYDADLTPNGAWNLGGLTAAGGVRSTAADLVKLVEAALAGDGSETPAATAALRDAMRVRHDNGREGAAAAIGLAWFRSSDSNAWWHNGMTGGYASSVSLAPEEGCGVVVLANTAAAGVTPLGEKLLQAARGERPEPIELPEMVEVDPELLASYEGTYMITPLAWVVVRQDDRGLTAQLTAQPALRLHAASPTEFRYRVVPARITFGDPAAPAEDDVQSLKTLTLHQNGMELRAVRMPIK